MKMRFTLNDDYKGVKGLVNCGKQIIDLGEDVKDGQIDSDNAHVQQTLSVLQGRSGRVFTPNVVKDDGTIEEVSVEPVPDRPTPRTPAEVLAANEAKEEHTTEAPNVGSGYETLPDNELKTLIAAAGLPVPTSATKAELIEILESVEPK